MRETVIKSGYSIVALVVLAVLLVSVITLAEATLRGVRLDLTENRLYTLSEGTHSILEGITEPINLYFFYTPEAVQDIPSINTYAQRVR